MIGASIAHYRITALLGEGGMGAVYRATDTKLNRDVAIKVLPEAFANDPDRLARFTREAQVLASLNHPNIATIHGIENGAIVMELVEGPTLADRIAGGALVVEETVRIARQLADALKAAHEKGIVHRDLKPANVKLTPDGVVKVLDFGLAKLSEPAEQPDPALAQTIAKGQSPTMAGMILGTAGYMSPEQAAGKVVDRRADIWAFGVLLWEMLCGATLFSGETVVHMLAEVLKTPIDLAKLPATIPQPLRTLIARCLERDLRNRLQDIGEARYTLERLESGVVEHQQPAPGRIRRWPWIAAVLLSAIAGAAGWIWRPTVEQPFMELAVKLPEGVSLPALIGYGAQMAFSPDGTRLAFVGVSKGRRGLWMRNLQTSTATMVPETWGANTPFWSPDSRHVAYFANGKLMRVDLSTGAASVICPIENVFGATWDPAGSILIGSRDGPLRRVSAEGGVPSLLPGFSGNSGVGQYTPFFLPGGNRFLYSSSADHFVYLASVDGKLNRKLMRSSTPPGYTEDSDSRKGWILQVDLTTLYATPFDARKNEVVGERVKVLDDVAPGPSSAASSGKLLAVRRSINTGYTLSWYRRNGEVADVVAEPGIIQDLNISADGKAAAWQESGRIWVHDLTRKVTAQFTTDAGTHPLWTNHGTALVYDTLRQGNTVAVERPVSGVIGEKILYQKEGRPQGVVSISADGRVAVIHDGSEVIVRTSDGRSIPFPGLNLTREQTISPDGDWCLASVRTGDSSEIDAYSVPAPAGGGKAMVKVRISAQGGRQPRWRKDGKEIFYIADDGQLTAVPVEMSRDFLRPGVPKTLFRTRLGRVSYDVSPDGQKFLLSQPSTDSAESWLTIIVNWPRLLKK